MTLVDSSAWIEYLRGTESEVDERVRRLLGGREALATTDVVLMEVLAGARDAAHLDKLRRLLGRCELVAIRGPDDYTAAADLYRTCRRAGDTIRNLIDCLVATVALREGLPLLHADADFEAIARNAPLRPA